MVVCSREDFRWALGKLDELELWGKVPVLFSPRTARSSPQDLAAWVLESGKPARLQLQLHKLDLGRKEGCVGMRRPCYVVDAFAARPLAGNPAGVLLDGADLDADAMQRIAAELKHSETAFPLPAREPDAALHLRWFAPASEMAFCGHATLATFHVLRRGGAPRFRSLPAAVTRTAFTCKSGRLNVELSRPQGKLRILIETPASRFEPAQVPGGPARGAGPRPGGARSAQSRRRRASSWKAISTSRCATATRSRAAGPTPTALREMGSAARRRRLGGVHARPAGRSGCVDALLLSWGWDRRGPGDRQRGGTARRAAPARSPGGAAAAAPLHAGRRDGEAGADRGGAARRPNRERCADGSEETR